jgi:hypothetical protein
LSIVDAFHLVQVSTHSRLRNLIKDLKLWITIGKTREYIGISSHKQWLPKRTQMAQQLRERIDKWDYLKLKSFCTRKEMLSILKKLPIVWEKNLCQLYIWQAINSQNMQGAQKTMLQKINDPMKK